MYHKHRECLNITTTPTGGSTTLPSQTVLDDASSDEINNDEASDAEFSSSLQERQKQAALFSLKARHVHKVAQSSIQSVMGDFTTLLESTVRKLKSRVT